MKLKDEYTQLLSMYRHRWNLKDNGDPMVTHSSVLQPMVWDGNNVILKIALVNEEKQGNQLMVQWNGHGAAKVFLHDDNSILLEQLSGETALFQMAQNGEDDQATKILCDVARHLHSVESSANLVLSPLKQWFNELFKAEEKDKALFSESASIARNLLESQINSTVLHGDLHHQNVLYSKEKGWLAIDPKGLYGENAYEFANLFCNPDHHVALIPGRLERQLDIVCNQTGIDRDRMLQWIVAYSALSASWSIQDGMDAALALSINAQALKLLS